MLKLNFKGYVGVKKGKRHRSPRNQPEHTEITPPICLILHSPTSVLISHFS